MKGLALQVVVAVSLLSGSSVAVCQTVAPPAHPITNEQVRQMLDQSHALDRMKDSITKMIQQQKSALPFFPDAFWVDFTNEFSQLDWVALATPVYQKYLSTEDADKAIAFYKTPAGQHALDATFAAYNDMAKIGTEQGRAIGLRLGEKYKDQIAENMKKAQQAQGAAPTPK